MEELYGQFVDELLTKKGITATPEQREALLNHIDEAVNNALLGALPEEQLNKLDGARELDIVDDGMVERMLAEAGVDPADVVSKTLDNYREKFMQENQ